MSCPVFEVQDDTHFTITVKETVRTVPFRSVYRILRNLSAGGM